MIHVVHQASAHDLDVAFNLTMHLVGLFEEIGKVLVHDFYLFVVFVDEGGKIFFRGIQIHFMEFF